MSPRRDSEQAAAIMLAAGLRPLEPYPGVGTPWHCECIECGAQVTPRFNQIQQGRAGGCMACGRRKAGQWVDPEAAVSVMREAGLEPLVPYPGQNKLPWLSRCTACGAEVSPQYSNVKERGRGCMECGRERSGLARRVEATEAERVMRDAGLEPLEPYPLGNKAWSCRCVRCKRIVSPTYQRVRAGSGCAYCTGSRVDVNDAIATMRAADLDPLDTFPGSDLPWISRCLKCGDTVSPAYSNIKRGQGGCASCGGTKPITGEDAVAIMREAGFEPLVPYPGGRVGWACRCMECGHEVAPHMMSVRHTGARCRYCIERAVDPIQADALVRERGLIPLEPYPGSDAPWRFRCATCEREFTRSWGVLRIGKTGCTYCDGTRLDPEDAVAIMRERGLVPLEPFQGTNIPWRCRCSVCDRESTPRLGSVRYGTGCRYCGGTYIDASDAIAAMRSAGLEPLDPYVSAKAPWRCRCQKCNGIVTPTYDAVTTQLSGCSRCSHMSFIGKPASIYLVVSLELDAVKVGIGRSRRRAARWAKAGWIIVHEVDCDEGLTAVTVEAAVLSWWRQELNAPFGATRFEVGTMGGWTETAPLWAIDLDETIARIDQAIADF